MTHRYRRTAAALLTVASMTTLAACGSSSSSSSGSGASGPGASGHVTPAGFKLTASEQSCLKQHGVALSGGPGFGRRPSGAAGAQGGPPSAGKRSSGAGGRGSVHGFAPHDAATQTAAFKACGVTVPSGPGPTAAAP